jgi:type II secretory pathway predicted ATPase ExeA
LCPPQERALKSFTLRDAASMYLAHWGLARSPFAASAAAPLFYEGETQVEAAARLRFVVRQGRRLAVVVGPAGVGKSALVQQFATLCRREGRAAAVASLAGACSRELLWQLAAQFALGPEVADDAVALFRRLAEFDQSLRWQRDGAVVVLDDADQAGADVRALLLRLMALSGETTRLTLILSVGAGEAWRLGDELLEAVDLRVDVEPWSESETIGYVQHALIEFGCDRPAFDDEALRVMYLLTDGVPRLVNRLADHALLAAAAEGRESVDAATIEAAHDALAWTTPV